MGDFIFQLVLGFEHASVGSRMCALATLSVNKPKINKLKGDGEIIIYLA